VARRYEKDLRAELGGRTYDALDDEVFGDIDDFFHERIPLRTVSRMLRLSTTRKRLRVPAAFDRAVPMTDAHRQAFFEFMKPRGKLVRQSRWRRQAPLREQRRQFTVIEDGEVAADASISDIDWGGGNLAVWTGKKHRRKGFGAAVTARAAAWCFTNDVIPIYWVHEENEPSIRLAKSLGFVLQSVEIAVRYRRH
jgi:RimJ/RimL family protein N-acetyltransferase